MIINRNPAVIRAAGEIEKPIYEYFGATNRQDNISLARMVSPAGWSEPGQIAQFDEYTLVLRGALRVEIGTVAAVVRAGEAVMVPRGTWVRYSTPDSAGAEYVAVCNPAFTPERLKRDEDGGKKWRQL